MRTKLVYENKECDNCKKTSPENTEICDNCGSMKFTFLKSKNESEIKKDDSENKKIKKTKKEKKQEKQCLPCEYLKHCTSVYDGFPNPEKFCNGEIEIEDEDIADNNGTDENDFDAIIENQNEIEENVEVEEIIEEEEEKDYEITEEELEDNDAIITEEDQPEETIEEEKE